MKWTGWFSRRRRERDAFAPVGLPHDGQRRAPEQRQQADERQNHLQPVTHNCKTPMFNPEA